MFNIFFKSSFEDMFLLILERKGERRRERKREGRGERERDIDVREKHGSVASCMCPDWVGIEPTTLWGTEQCSNQLCHLARAGNTLSLALAWLACSAFRCYWENPSWAILSKGTSSILSFLSPFLLHHHIYFLQSTYITVCKFLLAH